MYNMFRSKVCHRVTPLFDVDLALSTEVRITALFGPSGAGKSTVLKLVAGWIPSDTAVYVEGNRIDRDESGASVPLSLRNVGMVFQDDLLFPHLDAAGNASFARRYLANEKAYGDSGFAELVDKFGATHLLGKPVQALSGGERQRIGLIRALASRPKLLLCDEPVGAIDRAGRFLLLDRLREHVEAEGIVMLLITHDPEEIQRMAGHVWHIDSGRLLAEGPPERFFGAFGPNG